jgi:hypothetical protein
MFCAFVLSCGFILLAYGGSHRSKTRSSVMRVLFAGFVVSDLAGWVFIWAETAYGCRTVVCAVDDNRTKGGTPLLRRPEFVAGALLPAVRIGINGRGATSEATAMWNVRPASVDEHPERLWDWRDPQFLAR